MIMQVNLLFQLLVSVDWCKFCPTVRRCDHVSRIIRKPVFGVSNQVQGFCFAILGRGSRAFQIGKISVVNHYIGKFSRQTITAFSVNLKTNKLLPIL